MAAGNNPLCHILDKHIHLSGSSPPTCARCGHPLFLNGGRWSAVDPERYRKSREDYEAYRKRQQERVLTPLTMEEVYAMGEEERKRLEDADRRATEQWNQWKAEEKEKKRRFKEYLDEGNVLIPNDTEALQNNCPRCSLPYNDCDCGFSARGEE